MSPRASTPTSPTSTGWRDLDPDRILPNHGDPEVIAAGGYNRGLIVATQQYIRALMRCRDDPEIRDLPLRELIVGPLEAGWVHYFEPYEAVHRENLEAGIITTMREKWTDERLDDLNHRVDLGFERSTGVRQR